jgi:transcription elongation GreA/GreB family factor
MTQPTNTFDSYDANGIREDLSDVIFNVSPEETPLLSSIAKVSASNTLHEWQTDTLRSSTTNAHIEGDDTAAESRAATSRLGNYTQIFKNAVVTPDTSVALDNAGRGKEMSYQIVKVGAEQKLDIEKALMDNQAKVAGSSTAARRMAGLGAWITTNVNNVGTGGANPTGNGSNARTDGAKTAFTQADFDTTMQEIWAEGGKPDMVILSASQMNLALGFTGNNNQRSTIGAADGKVANLMNIYMTPWGSVEFVPARENRSRDVFIIEKDKLAFAELRKMKNVALAKTGDNEKRQVVCEGTLVVRNEKALGAVVDCS